MKFSNVFLSAVLAALVLPAIVTAQESGDPDTTEHQYIRACKRFKILVRSINLTDEQKAATATLLDGYRTEVSEIAPELHQAKKELFFKVHIPKEVVDENEIIGAHQAVSSIEEDILIAYTYLMNEIFQVVEPWQYKRMVAARINLKLCSMAPVRVFRRHLNRWINRYRDGNRDGEENS